MPIVGVQFTRVEAKREGAVKPGVKINSTPKILSVEERNLEMLGKKSNVLLIKFEFVSVYEPKVATVKIDGEILFTDGDAKKAIRQWKKEKTLPEHIVIEVLNTIFRKCLSRVLTIAEDMQLPSPVPMPTVTPKKAEDDAARYIG